jgi:hypothetical protein
VELRAQEGGAGGHVAVGVRHRLGTEVVEAAVGEGREVDVRAQAVVHSRLVVPELDAHLVVDERQDRPGVAVATGEGERAASRATLAAQRLRRGGALLAPAGLQGGGLALGAGGLGAVAHAAAVERDLEQPARVGQADVYVAVDPVAARGHGAGLDDAAGVATEPHGSAAGVEVDRVDELRVDHRRTDGHVEEDRHARTVEVVAGVARGRAAHDHVGQEARERGHAGQAAHHPQRVAARARYAAQLVAAQRGARDRDLALGLHHRAVHVAVERGVEAQLDLEILARLQLHRGGQVAVARRANDELVPTGGQHHRERAVALHQHRGAAVGEYQPRVAKRLPLAEAQHLAAQASRGGGVGGPAIVRFVRFVRFVGGIVGLVVALRRTAALALRRTTALALRRLAGLRLTRFGLALRRGLQRHGSGP